MMWRTVLACAFCGPAFSQNTTVDDLVGEAVFGVKWADTLEAVKARYPTGKQSEIKPIRYWTVPDNRTVFEIERGRRDTIQFGFLGEALTVITVTMPDCIEANGALFKFLGPMSEIRPTSDNLAAASVGIALPVDLGAWTGSKASIRLVAIGNDCNLYIGPASVTPVEASRRQLGLE
jgi:hypothetical protein